MPKSKAERMVKNLVKAGQVVDTFTSTDIILFFQKVSSRYSGGVSVLVCREITSKGFVIFMYMLDSKGDKVIDPKGNIVGDVVLATTVDNYIMEKFNDSSMNSFVAQLNKLRNGGN